MRTILVATAILIFNASPALAAPADLDPSFGAGTGIVTVPFATTPSIANGVALQSDGKIVAAGFAGDTFAVARLNAGGTLDGSFGSGGMVLTDVPGGSEQADAVAIQPDGMIVVAGERSSPKSVILARYDGNGVLDPSFGTGGIVITAGEIARALVLQPDGMIVVGGPGADGFTLVRYDGFGNLDPTFGVGGVTSTEFAPSAGMVPELYALALQSDGMIVAAGGAGTTVAVARFDMNGALDPNFGTGGQVTTTVTFGFGAPSTRANGVLVQPDGEIVIGGFVASTFAAPHTFQVITTADAIMARYDTNGTPDALFGMNGGMSIAKGFTTSVGFSALARQSDGKLVGAGLMVTSDDLRFDFVARVTTTGTEDSTFNDNGGATGGAYALAIQPDRKLVTAGYDRVGPSHTATFRVARYNGGECGDNVLDAGEICDDGNTTSGDGCDANCTPTGCGNGIVTTSEDCEPSGPSDCCSPTCQFDPAGTTCPSTGNVCANHTCDGAGTCTHTVAPSDTCVAAPVKKSSLQITTSSTTPAKRALQWKWKGGAVTSGDLADPQQSQYALCVYDRSGNVPSLRLTVPLQTFGWRTRPKGFEYKDTTGTYSGVRKATLESSKGIGKLAVQAKGPFTPGDATTLPMSVDPSVTVQLRNDAGGCWCADYTTPSRNEDERFKAKN